MQDSSKKVTPGSSVAVVGAEESQPGPSTSSKSVVETPPSPETNLGSPMEVSSTTVHEFSQPEPPATSAPSSSTPVGVKEKYEDLSEESPEEGESED